MKTFNVRFTHEVLGSTTLPIEGDSYDHAAEKLRRELRRNHPNAMLRIHPEQPIPLTDTERAAQEDI